MNLLAIVLISLSFILKIICETEENQTEISKIDTTKVITFFLLLLLKVSFSKNISEQ
jgi:hypothetical protein